MRAQATISDFMSNVIVAFRSLADTAGVTGVNIYGPKDDGANSAPPGIWWAIGRETWQRAGLRGGQPGDPGSLWVRNVSITMLLFGGEVPPSDGDTEEAALDGGTFLRETDATEALVELLVNAFQQQVSQFSYDVTGGNWGESSRTGIGVAFEMDVSLRLPLVRIDNETVTLKGIHAEQLWNTNTQPIEPIVSISGGDAGSYDDDSIDGGTASSIDIRAINGGGA